ncbi:MAG: hypothetical protein COZ49_01540 [Candidatus Yonathbacteria bacterium CG_4_10_14_3_um_filter_47_65]|uniref:Bacterial spore germination immunoglobulin-like domain-containing protein n=2 Tax=Parcubacteria group TaxID=1794811 RepID=A0A2M8D5R1_9BACT|nr:MAG: hypothetical protein AUJ44_02305 [Candidatus Nomurabacteria bacterium CG1_02_47_685]PIP03299.1 MAG: hypothetical protein COX54_04080 [Candidatus Yonathbacteria bacterium CG23_combo_of_CG06-09_8_20_14_all_46_18]PIQ32037.1 MAG: hypothetical protein COW61_02475 [Candidatus Yonathbacteria bacterium CG17_big_fil_post_rev_8_21_14_2_50_46_19]PIX56524.1 MAG: hypothetical protein COZ49_01540 [Candidatus Yonathbacteria bacterium CG_4_10_14_3_um_filter_47_65]PIY58028.1 MAG: hypothetical protein CO
MKKKSGGFSFDEGIFTAMSSKKRRAILGMVLGIFLIVTGVLFFVVQSSQLSKQAEIISFEACVAVGNPVMESYPRQCSTKDGKHFVENIGNELEKTDLIRISAPRPNETIMSPVMITGAARGIWYFEATFPVFVVDWDGKIIAEGYATAQDEWMTEAFVPFEAELAFDTADISGNYFDRGTLILKKDNPSGLPEHDDALEIPIVFGEWWW